MAELAKRSKRWHEFMSRLLSYIGHRRGLGLRRVEADLRECMPRKTSGGGDIYVPPVEKVAMAGRKLSATPRPTLPGSY